MRERQIILFGMAAAVAAALLTQAGCATTAAPTGGAEVEERTISVSGTGTVSGEPDQVTVRLGVESTAETANAAMSQNSEQMQAVIDALTGAGIPRDQIQTQTVQLRPQYETPEPEPGQPRRQELVGYLARNIVEVRSEDLGAIGDLLDAAAQAGANRMEGISFEVTNAQELLSEARELAWEDAQAKAEQLVDLAGAALGEVQSISESTRGPQPVRAVEVVEREAAVPIEPGAEEIQVDLQVVWAID